MCCRCQQEGSLAGVSGFFVLPAHQCGADSCILMEFGELVILCVLLTSEYFYCVNGSK